MSSLPEPDQSPKNPGSTGRKSLRRWLDTVTLILAVLAIIFAIIQFGDAKNQLKEARAAVDQLRSVTGALEPLARSVQTRFVGSFPDNMEDMMNVVKSVPDRGQLRVMTDFSGYGLYSKNDLYLQYITELRSARNKRNVYEKVLVYDQALAGAALRKQFTSDRYNQERNQGFRGFFRTHPPPPKDYEDFLSRLTALLEHSIDEMCSDGIEVRRVPASRKYLFFLWANSRPQALFAFRNESESYRELSFATIDTNLIEVFRVLFDDTWEAVDPKKDKNLLGGMSQACRAMAESR
jgi:hypothetical protein